jgi:phosphoglucomutase
MALELARKTKADLVMGTDPDSDRLGIAVRDGQEYRLLSGNQLGVLLLDYILESRSELGTLPAHPAFVKTIVTTELGRLIAEKHGAISFDTLTGFKYIAAKIREFEADPNGPTFVFGCEESYGYLVGTEVRDKDAVSAATLTAEMALYHQSQGSTIIKRLDDIYREYGTFQEILLSRSFEGAEGMDERTRLMERLRKHPPRQWAGRDTKLIRDYLNGSTRDAHSGETNDDIELPSSNVLQFVLEDETIITARPSGTEPKIKFYASCCSGPGPALETTKKEVDEKLKKIADQIDSLL